MNPSSYDSTKDLSLARRPFTQSEMHKFVSLALDVNLFMAFNYLELLLEITVAQQILLNWGSSRDSFAPNLREHGLRVIFRHLNVFHPTFSRVVTTLLDAILAALLTLIQNLGANKDPSELPEDVRLFYQPFASEGGLLFFFNRVLACSGLPVIQAKTEELLRSIQATLMEGGRTAHNSCTNTSGISCVLRCRQGQCWPRI